MKNDHGAGNQGSLNHAFCTGWGCESVSWNLPKKDDLNLFTDIEFSYQAYKNMYIVKKSVLAQEK